MREYTFLVDTGATYVGLPAAEIAELGLIRVPGGRMQFNTAEGMVERDTFGAFGQLEDQGFSVTVIATPILLPGYETLENLRFKVNSVTEKLERGGPEEFHPPYLL